MEVYILGPVIDPDLSKRKMNWYFCSNSWRISSSSGEEPSVMIVSPFVEFAKVFSKEAITAI